MKTKLYFLYYIFLMPLYHYAQISDTTQARLELEQADSLLLADDYFTAIGRARNALQLYEITQNNPIQQAAAYSLLANALLEMGQLENAAKQLEKNLDFCKKTFGENHQASAQAYNDFGNYLLEQAQLESAQEYFTTSLHIRQKVLSSQHPDIADSFNNLGNVAYLQGQYAAAIQHYTKALDSRILSFGEQHIDIASSYFNLGNCAFHQGDLKQAFELYQQTLNIRGNVLGKQHPDCGKALLMLGRCLQANDNWEQAIQYYTQSKLIFDAAEGQASNQAYSADYIGSCYAQLGRTKEALVYHQKAGSIRQKIYDNTHPILGESWNNIGNAYFKLGDFGRAMQYYQLAIRNLENTAQSNLAATYENLGICYRYQKKYTESISLFSKALSLQHPNSSAAANTYINMGNVYADAQQYEAARNYYKKSLNLAANIASQDRISALNNIGIAYFEEGAHTEGLTYFQQAIQLADSTYGENSIPSVQYLKNAALCHRALGKTDLAFEQFDQAIEILTNEKLGKDWTQVQAPLELLGVLEAKAETYFQQADLEEARQLYTLALNLLDNLRTYYYSYLSKQKLNEYNRKLFEQVLVIYQLLEEQGKITAIAEDIMQVLEQSKSLLLLDALLKTEANTFGGIPDSLIAEERALLEGINTLEQTRYQAQGTNTFHLSTEIAALKQRHTQLVQTFEQAYPKYYQLKYGANYISIAEVQDFLLEEGQTMLEYFVGDNAIFVLLIQKTRVQFFRIEKDFPLEKWILNLHDAIGKYFVAGKTSAEIYNEVYIDFAQKLYQHLFPEVLQAQLTETLIIIPDGALGYLPFDLLLTKAPDNPTRFKQFDYFLRQYQVSYAYSPSLLYQIQTRKSERPKEAFLGIAPQFKNTDLQLSDLVYNKEEVEALATLFPSKLLLDTAATAQNFHALAASYRIIHLATHGLADNRAGQFSYIAFSNDSTSTKNDLLYVNDLYNTQINADMVVLSACETALGEFQQGEGIISLARGFSYAGAKSVITTLWSIDDKTTSNLMQRFYEYLQAGLPKDAALRQAKLQLIENETHESAHPYYWAAFIPLGEMKAVESGGFIWWWILLVVVVVSLGYLVYRWFFSTKSGRWSAVQCK